MRERVQGNPALAAAVAARMRYAFPGELRCFGTVTSTMDAAREMLGEGVPGWSAALADAQTQGAGRLGRGFVSPAGEGVWTTLLFRPAAQVPDGLLTQAAGLAVCRAVEDLCGFSPRIKWPNDVILDNRKLCGILFRSVEDAHGRGLLAGIGLNLSQRQFPPELAEKAVSLEMLGAAVPREAAAAALYDRLFELISPQAELKLPAGPLLCELRARSCTLGREVRVISGGQEWRGRAAELAASGALLVETDAGQVEISSGEASVRGLLGYP